MHPTYPETLSLFHRASCDGEIEGQKLMVGGGESDTMVWGVVFVCVYLSIVLLVLAALR